MAEPAQDLSRGGAAARRGGPGRRALHGHARRNGDRRDARPLHGIVFARRRRARDAAECALAAISVRDDPESGNRHDADSLRARALAWPQLTFFWSLIRDGLPHLKDAESGPE